MKTFIAIACLLATTSARADGAADAKATLSAWQSAQNRSDFDAYIALYDPAFVGVKRTSGGKERTLTLGEWSTDRKKMFQRKQEVAADNPKIETAGGNTKVSFTQRWRGGRYADHGEKVITLRAAGAGAMKIVREELRSSLPGWEDNPQKVFDATALAAPITLRVEAENPGSNDDCQNVTYFLSLQDKNKKKLRRELGPGLRVPHDKVETVALEKSGAGFEFNGGCDGGTDHYQIKKSGDALVILWKHQDQDSGLSLAELGWDTQLTVQLPAAAQVKPAE